MDRDLARMGQDHQLGFADLIEEVRDLELLVEGEVPSWLSGMLVRNGAALWDTADGTIRHWFDGLAMLRRFGFHGGRVSYTNRFLRSPQYLSMRKHGKRGYQEFGTPSFEPLFRRLGLPSSGYAHNTNVSVCKVAGRYFAITETPGMVEFDPATLDTLGVVDFEDGVGGTIYSTHPQTDPVSGELISSVTHFRRRSCYRVLRVPAGGLLRKQITEIPVPEPAYMHSFGQSERYVILTEHPLVAKPLKTLARIFVAGKSPVSCLEWEPERGTRFRVVDKQRGELTGSYETESFLCLHHVNSFERAGELVVDLIAYPDSSIISMFEMESLRGSRSEIPANAIGQLRRYRIPLAAVGPERVRYEALAETALELPTINQQYAGREHSFIYGVGGSASGSVPWPDRLSKISVSDARNTMWRREGCYPSEPVFVAEPNGEAEDDGVILSVVLDGKAGVSFLLVLHAKSMNEVGRAYLPHHLPFDFHGAYFSDDGEER